MHSELACLNMQQINWIKILKERKKILCIKIFMENKLLYRSEDHLLKYEGKRATNHSIIQLPGIHHGHVLIKPIRLETLSHNQPITIHHEYV